MSEGPRTEQGGVAVELLFVTGRYHATPWSQHVNEGAVEWPPSPWRIYRALIATWHLKARDTVSEGAVASLIEKLATTLPIYALPEATHAHTRHFMPQYKPDKTSKIFDAFLHIEGDRPLRVAWPGVRLNAAETQALKTLLARLGYLGRAESWVEGRVVEMLTGGYATLPEGHPEARGAPVSLLTPLSTEALTAWRSGVVGERERSKLAAKQTKAEAKGKDPTRVKLSAKEKRALEAGVPSTLLEALEVSTADLNKGGWSQPPGTRWQTWLKPKGPRALRQRRVGGGPKAHRPQWAHLAVDAKVRPRITGALAVGHAIHKALVKANPNLPLLRGCDENRAPLLDHQHLHILPAPPSGQRLSRICLYAPGGLGNDERLAFDKLCAEEISGEGRYPFTVTLLGFDDGGGPDAPLMGPSRTWVSLTPFRPTRYGKRRKNGEPKLNAAGHQIDGPEDELIRLLVARGLPRPIRVERLKTVSVGQPGLRPGQFRLQRPGGGGRAGPRVAFSFKLTFAEAVPGPVIAGYGAHFGLGVFIPPVSQS